MTYTKVAASSQEAAADEDADDPPNCGQRPQSQQRQRSTSSASGRSAKLNGRGAGGADRIPEGFSTEAALHRLDEDISGLLAEYEEAIEAESFLTRTRHFLRHRSATPLAPLPIALTLLAAVALFATAHPISATCLTLLLVASLALCAREHHLRRTELHRKCRHMLAEIRAARRLSGDWTDANYPHLCSPLSPCVTLQWTYRDGRIVNLPWALLVRDDCVVLRPGQVAPGTCQSLDGSQLFVAGETYGLAEPAEPPLKPMARAPLPDLRCRLRETPYLENLRVSLAKFDARPVTMQNLQRDWLVTRVVQSWGALVAVAVALAAAAVRHRAAEVGPAAASVDWPQIYVLAPCCAVLPILPLVFPVLWIALDLWGVARLQTLLAALAGGRDPAEVPGAQANGGRNGKAKAAEMTTTDEEEDGGDNEAKSTIIALEMQTVAGSPGGGGQLLDGSRSLPKRAVLRRWMSLWRGDSRLLARSANVVQVLGSVTALCCVDKKGILSWPNPTAEKVFFLRDGERAKQAGKKQQQQQQPLGKDKEGDAGEVRSAGGDAAEERGGEGGGGAENQLRPTSASAMMPAGPRVVIGQRSLASQTSMDSDTSAAGNHTKTSGGAVAEVLDLTHDQHSPFRLAFDDHAWSAHLQSLKPLGLAILVNTCCPHTQAHYAQFCNHVTAVAQLDKDLVPVTNRYEIVESRLNSFMHGRCLCELAKQIGFTDAARDIFQLEGQIASYMHLQPDVVRRDIRFARQLHLASKVKVPFPHSLSVVMRETPGNSLQLLTQGTADIVLDCCDDYWDGRDLRPLSASERKRAQDFYQRSALTAYCTAFSYRPLRRGISGALGAKLAGQTAYLELPPEMRYRLKQQRTPSFTYDSAEHGAGVAAAALANAARLQQHSLSSDSLLLAADQQSDTDCDEHHHLHQHHHHHGRPRRSRRRPPNPKVQHLHADGGDHHDACDDVDSCFEMQCHQVFIGMVTMQYQAQIDIVQLIERLDQACVRFVHFSKENELRSRVFSEKMGLESGWNCHISLLSNSKSGSGGSGSTLPSPKLASRLFGGPDQPGPGAEQNRLLPAGPDSRHPSCASAPGCISTAMATQQPAGSAAAGDEATLTNSNSSTDNSFELEEFTRTGGGGRRSRGAAGPDANSAMVDENCRSLSSLTVSTEQSAPINFDMSNRAKLPRGIENIEPHLESVDNVPLLVSLFTDCSAEATREMLGIMQRHGEVVVCMGSSASNANAEIFLQADCGIGVEPLYPQVCQSIDAFEESNLRGNRRKLAPSAADPECGCDGDRYADNLDGLSATVSPIYLSRTLNSVACSVAICRDESLSILALIELSRRFSCGLWSCIQFWASCAASCAVLNAGCACVGLPPILTPGAVLWLMVVAVPLLAVTLVRQAGGDEVMRRATGKKQMVAKGGGAAGGSVVAVGGGVGPVEAAGGGGGVIGVVMFCYGCKFLPSMLIMLLSYCALVSHPVAILHPTTAPIYPDLAAAIDCARAYILLALIVHFVCISSSFVHRDYSIWRRNPASNAEWWKVAIALLCGQMLRFGYDLWRQPELGAGLAGVWPIVTVLFGSVLLVAAITEICKWEELKVNARQQRRARLDFGTKLGMNSPF